jgi:type II restriction enzyme
MTDISFYSQNLKLNNNDSIERFYCDTLVETNLTYSFFVDWEKVCRNRDEFRSELGLLSSIRGVENPKQYLKELIFKYPEIVRVFPLLLAERDKKLKVLESLIPVYLYAIYDFNKPSYSDKDIELIVEFCEKTRLLTALTTMESPIDYLTGVEVGLDSNARKNRSGNFMEDAIDEILNHINTGLPTTRISQKTFRYVQEHTGLSVPQGLLERKFDEVVIIDGIGINIEVNFYGGTGSKPSEIVESYINRNRELKESGWKFIWVTDGDGWRKMRNQLRKGLDNLDYVFNLKMLSSGLLEKVLSIKGK